MRHPAVEIRAPGVRGERLTVIEWTVGDGERVDHGDEIALLASPSAMFAVRASGAGTLREILVGEGSPVDPLQPLAVLDQRE